MQQRGKMVVVKKYSNRRLYDTAESRYITLEELSQKIKRGTDVKVIDAASEEDLTQVTLTQLILESGRAGRLLPVPLLAQLIRLDDDELAEFFNRYMSWAMEMYQHARNGAQALAPYNPFATLPFVTTNALARLFGSQSGWGGGTDASNGPGGASVSQPPPPPAYTPPPPEPPPPSNASPTNGNDEVAELRRELEELKDAIRAKLR